MILEEISERHSHRDDRLPGEWTHYIVHLMIADERRLGIEDVAHWWDGDEKIAIVAWCMEEFGEGRWKYTWPGYSHGVRFYFVHQEDAMHFMLRWGG